MSGARGGEGWSEARLHRWLAKRSEGRRLLAGSPMHDAACLRPVPGRPTLCADQTLEGVHFEPGTPARRVGGKAVARVLSDLAATAARPHALTLAVAAPGQTSERYLRGLIEGAAEMASRHGAELVAGDLARTHGSLAVVVSGLGHVAGRRPCVGRDRASAGEVVVLSGAVGGSRLGRHLSIVPRVELGCELHGAGARAMMDVSDGLALDLSRLAAASGIRIELDLERLPVHPDARRASRKSGRTPLEHALHDGEDHELVATLPAPAWQRSAAALARRHPGLVRIGSVRTGEGLGWSGAGNAVEPLPRLDTGGWIHGE